MKTNAKTQMVVHTHTHTGDLIKNKINDGKVGVFIYVNNTG